jgi:hypothetical protein
VDEAATLHRYLQARLAALDNLVAKIGKLPDSPKRAAATHRLYELRSDLLAAMLGVRQSAHDERER